MKKFLVVFISISCVVGGICAVLVLKSPGIEQKEISVVVPNDKLVEA